MSTVLPFRLTPKRADSRDVATHVTTAHPSFGLRPAGCWACACWRRWACCCAVTFLSSPCEIPARRDAIPSRGAGRCWRGDGRRGSGCPFHCRRARFIWRFSSPNVGCGAKIAPGGCVIRAGSSRRPRRWLPLADLVSGNPVGGGTRRLHLLRRSRRVRLACGRPGLAALRHWSRRLLTPAGAGLAILVLGQAVVFRHPYNVQADVIGTVTKPSAAADHHARIVADGRLFDLDPAKLPVIGSTGASHFIVVLSDYTCEHCRVTHRMLERSERILGDRVGVIVLPVLLDPAANPYLPLGSTHPLPQDVALTRIALGVYCARPAAFAEMNRWLFAEDRVRKKPKRGHMPKNWSARKRMRSAERDTRISPIILTGCELFARSGSGSIPRMLIGSTQISGQSTTGRPAEGRYPRVGRRIAEPMSA